MITDPATERILALSPQQIFLGVITYKMAAKINCHRYGTRLRHCHRICVLAVSDSVNVYRPSTDSQAQISAKPGHDRLASGKHLQ